MDARLIEKFWNAQFADPDHKNVKKFINDVYKVFVPYRKWKKVCRAYDRFLHMDYTEKDMLCMLRFYLEAKGVYKRMKKIFETMDTEEKAMQAFVYLKEQAAG